MNAAEVRTALTKRWPDSEYLHIQEAPLDHGRQGRKLDTLVLSLWQSRGHERDGVEIKVSRSDWTREIAQPAKADEWWAHVHRFWIAMPADLALKVRDDGTLPTGWGLLACTLDGAQVLVKPSRNPNPKPFTWNSTLGLLRASADAGPNALARARADGHSEGLRRGKDQAARESGQAWDDKRKAEHADLVRRVAEFRELTGIDITSEWKPLEEAALLVAFARNMHADPGYVSRRIRDLATSMRKQATDLEAGLDIYSKILTPEATS